MLYKASAPGSLMLLGEYAVLHGKKALVAAIDQRMCVTLAPRQDKVITLTSALGKLTVELSDITLKPPFQFVLAVLQHANLSVGCDITITADFSHQMGFGSSAAVTVATLAAVKNWLQEDIDLQDLMQQAKEIIYMVQGSGSGADVAAAVYGGVVSYLMQPLMAEKISQQIPLTVVYSGSKTKTPDAIRYVQGFFAPFPDVFMQICQGIGECSEQGILALRDNDWVRLGKIMDVQQGLLDSLQVNTDTLRAIIASLKAQGSLGVKISGAGLGDCVIALGEINVSRPWIKIPVTISDRGVNCEKI